MLRLLTLLLLTPLVAAAQQPSAPAAASPRPFDCSDPVHRQFDFWIGEWDVVPNPDGTPPPPTPKPGAKPPTNTITKAHGGCVLIENWNAPALNQTGQSFNVYDRSRGRWHQTWVDNSGALHEYWGGLQDGNMVFMGEVPLGPTTQVAGRNTVRLRFFNLGPDKVRQFSERLLNNGTWAVNYDLIYARRK